MYFLKRFLGIFICLFVCASAMAGQSYRIYTGEGNEIEIDVLAKALLGYNAVFIGEYHGNETIHKFQHELLPLIHKFNNKISISMEMFERDVQHLLDSFLAGEISHDEFLSNSRPWINYTDDYQPIVLFAKDHALPVIASNIPRRVASLYARHGTLDNISESDKKYLPGKIVVLEDEYKRRFIETIGNIGHPRGESSGPENMSIIDRMYKAQCLKDDTMAESIYHHLRDNEERTVVHFNGDFHSRSHLGTVQKLKMLNEDLAIAVITPLITEDINNIVFDEDYSSFGDFILFIDHNH